MRSALDPNLSFSEAAALWLDNHRDHIKPRTASDYQQYIDVLRKFGLTLTPLRDIHIGTFAEYQLWRKTNPKRGAGNPRINQELNCLSQILDQAGLWKDIEHYYRPLRMPKWKPPRVMTPEKEDEVLRIAASNKNWEVAHCALVLTDNSAIGPGEMRAIQLEHLRLDAKVIYVAAGDDGDKNPFRIAPMALNEPALAALEVLVARYREICRKQGIAERGDHYLFPKRVKKGTYDPTQMASSSFIRSALREIRAVAGMPKLRHYDFRHQVITSLLEIPGVSTETVQAVARHKVGTRTIEHYSKIRIQAKQQALDLLNEHRRAAALRRPPQRENTDAAPLAQAASFAGNQSYPQR
jgi:integrase